MAYRTKDQNTYVHGEWNAICDVCGFKFKSSDLREQWNGDIKLMVCKDDYESRHPMDNYEGPIGPEGNIPWSKPDSAEAGGTDISGGTFPPTYTHTIVKPALPDDDDDGVPDGTFDQSL